MRATLTMFLVLVLGGQGRKPAPATRPARPPDGQFLTLDTSENWCRPMWLGEAQRRFDKPLVVFGHGGTCDGGWCVWMVNQECKFPMPVSWVAERVKEQFPDRQIVLIICNPDHMRLHVAGVWYALDDIWLMPDREIFNEHREPQETVGKIEEFISD